MNNTLNEVMGKDGEGEEEDGERDGGRGEGWKGWKHCFTFL